MIGLALYFSGSLNNAVTFLTTPIRFEPSMFANDRDCSDFKTRFEAQAFFRQAGAGDPHRLDDDGDGLVCEFNPWFDISSWFGR